MPVPLDRLICFLTGEGREGEVWGRGVPGYFSNANLKALCNAFHTSLSILLVSISTMLFRQRQHSFRENCIISSGSMAGWEEHGSFQTCIHSSDGEALGSEWPAHVHGICRKAFTSAPKDLSTVDIFHLFFVARERTRIHGKFLVNTYWEWRAQLRNI